MTQSEIWSKCFEHVFCPFEAAPTDLSQKTIAFDFFGDWSGNFHVRVYAAPGANQDGGFEMFSGAVPTSLAGKQVRCVVNDGLSPFAFTGSFTMVAAASGNTHSVVGVGCEQFGDVFINAATGKIQLTDSGD